MFECVLNAPLEKTITNLLHISKYGSTPDLVAVVISKRDSLPLVCRTYL